MQFSVVVVVHCVITVKGAPRNFHWGQDRSTESRQRDGSLGEGAATPSPPARCLESAVSSPSGVQGGAPTAQRFSLFSALRMASRDTMMLLIVDVQAGTENKTPYPPSVRPVVKVVM